MNRLEGKTAIVTGAGSGIGRATALRLADEGARVRALDVVPAGLETLPKEVTGTGSIVTGEVDIASEESVDAAVKGAVAELGGLDALVNAAGILFGDHTHLMTLERWNRLLTVNLTGTFLMTREALPALLEAPAGGRLVNMASTSSFFAHPYMAAYAATKGAIMAFTHSVALEYEHRGLRAVNICPGSIVTGISENTLANLPEDVDWKKFAKIQATLDGGKRGNPDNIAGVVAMLISEDGAFITGTEIRVDGGTHQ